MTNSLAGNGVALVREIALATRVQTALERLYQIDRIAGVDAFMKAAGAGEREALLVRESEDGSLELELRVPFLARREFDAATDADLDPLCQIIEGVSHFVYLADRARRGREATELEMELQAEVDKYVVLAASVATLDVRTSATLRKRLYEQISFAHDGESEHGERYRLANEVAQKFTRRLERDFVEARRFTPMREELRRFYRLGQEEKMRAGRAA